MASNPLISQGYLNRLRASITVASFPTLDVTAPYLGKEAIRVAFEGDAAMLIPTQTGAVASGEPYQLVSITASLLMSQPLAAAYKAQFETNSSLGAVTVTPTSSALPNYNFAQVVLRNVRELNLNGDDPGFVVTMHGVYYINSNLWNLV